MTPSIFITYNCDLSQSLPGCITHCFADDLAAIISGQLGVRYSEQCLDLEIRLNNFLDHLYYYSVLSDQPINFNKTEAMFSARAIGDHKFLIEFSDENNTKINWVKEYKYLGYIISPKLGWGKLLKKKMVKARQRIALITRFKLFGCSSPHLRRALFSSFVLPIFTWIYPIFPFLSKKQQDDLSHFYYYCLRRVLFCLS